MNIFKMSREDERTHPTFSMAALQFVHGLLFGDVADGNCLAEAARIIDTTEERCNEAELYRSLGNLLDATGDQASTFCAT